MKIIFAARLIDFKDPITFVRASLVLPQHDFVVAGDGKLLNECRKMAGRNVTFLGWVPQSVVNENMTIADVFCQLSPVENIWSSSMILAMKIKKAMVCTNVGYTNRFLENGVHALLIPARNEIALANALVRLENEELRQTLGMNAYQCYRNALEITGIIKQIRALIQEASTASR